ncbi:MAG: protein BatD [Bacteroidaceae bacterium]|nr:protein BatD [Bacteroidaceae bacterium]
MKHIIVSIILLLTTLGVNAAVTVTAKAPAAVGVGEQFRLQYTVNSADVAGQPHIGNVAGFDVVYGPAISTSHSFTSINGHSTENSSTTFTFTLIARKEGKYQVPAVTLNVGGNNYTSNSPTVQVVKGSGYSTGSQNARTSQSAPGGQSTSSQGSHRVGPGDLYIEVSANKRTVYEQEPVLLSYNVYTTQALEQLQGKMPDLKGFVAKEVPLPREKHLSIVNRNGRTVQTTTWSQYVMFPQQSGKLTIPSIPFEGVIAYANRNIDPIDAFFFGTNATTRINHTVHAPALDITVKPLPTKPSTFSGGVGNNFAISAVLASKTPRENETLTLKVKISGTGNIDLITPPEVHFPADFEQLDNKSVANTTLTPEGMKGDLTIEYYAIPNHKGQYVIPPVELTYFSPADGEYHTISSGKPVVVKVAKGNPNSYAARQRMKNDDIRHIHLDPISADSTAGGGGMLPVAVVYVLLVALFVVAYIILQLRQRRSADVQGRLLRKAGSKANARLRTAQRMMQSGKASEFYAETLSALRDFVADKLALPVTDVTKEKISALFAEYGVPEELSMRYSEAVSDCELHIYGVSSDNSEEMHRTYKAAEEIITKLNPLLKKKKK